MTSQKQVLDLTKRLLKIIVKSNTLSGYVVGLQGK